ncbi:MAG: periplasmic heavy metal sensor [Pseudomonadota bacterium]
MSDTGPEIQPKATGKRSTRWRGALLTGSLMANTLFVGLFLGQWVSGPTGSPEPRGRERGPPPQARIAEQLIRAAPAERRTEIRQAFRNAIGEVRPQFAARHEARAELRAAMVADPFDPERLEAAFAALRERQAALDTAIQTALVEQLGSLSVEDRQAIAEGLSRGRGPVRGGGPRRLPE